MALAEAPRLVTPRQTKDSPEGAWRLKDPSRVIKRVREIIEIAPNGMLGPRELEDSLEYLDVSALRKDLKEQGKITEEEAAELFIVSMETESATDTYSEAIQKVAKHDGSGWLGEFNNEVWDPDEQTHRLPYKIILMHMGFSEEDLDRRMRMAQQRSYHHLDNKSSIYVTTFAMLQEYTTYHVHGVNTQILHKSNKIAAHGTGKVRGRELLHNGWFKELTGLQIIDSPSNIGESARAAYEFDMPNSEVSPEYSGNIKEIHGRLGVDTGKLFNELIVMLEESMESRRNFGELITKIGSEADVKLMGRIPARFIDKVFNKLGGSLYTAVGNATLEAAGIIEPSPDYKIPTPMGEIVIPLQSFLRKQIGGVIESIKQGEGREARLLLAA